MIEPVLCEFQPEKRIQGVELSEPGRGRRGSSQVPLAWEGREESRLLRDEEAIKG